MYLIEKNMKLTIFSAYVNIHYELFFYNKQVDFFVLRFLNRQHSKQFLHRFISFEMTWHCLAKIILCRKIHFNCTVKLSNTWQYLLIFLHKKVKPHIVLMMSQNKKERKELQPKIWQRCLPILVLEVSECLFGDVHNKIFIPWVKIQL